MSIAALITQIRGIVISLFFSKWLIMTPDMRLASKAARNDATLMMPAYKS